MRDVGGKTAFVTGGASGIGLGMAKVFLEAGMRVAIADVREDHLSSALEALRRSSPSGVHAIRLDVTDREAMRRAAAETVAVFGRVHLLCNNAGIGLLGSVKDAGFDDWDWMVEVNLNGVFNGIREFLPHLRAHGEGGHILSTASIGGLIATNTAGVYSACKFGVVTMMQCLREDLAGEEIGVSVLCPAGVRTRIHEAEQMRPQRFAHSGYRASEDEKAELQARLKNMLAAGMDPIEVGRRVLQGIRRNELYIFTHPVREVLQQRRDAILASLPDEPVNHARLEMDLRVRSMMKRGARR